jgi:hypothetical protein
LIETDRQAIRRDGQNLIRLQLIRLAALPEGIGDSSCTGMRALAASEEDSLRLLDEQLENVVSAKVEEQDGGRCVYVVHYRDRSPLTGMYEHIYVIKAPAGETALAEWDLTVIDDAHDGYETAIRRVIDTLQASASSG